MGLAGALLVLIGGTAAHAGERRVVPDVRRYGVEDARRRLEGSGFRVGEVYEISTQRILETWKVRYPIGYVWMQNPAPGGLWDTDVPVDVMISAAQDGKLPPSLPGVEPRPAPDAPGSAAPPPGPAPKGDAPGADPGGAPGARPRGEGAPDAPGPAPAADPNRVPELTGLDLVAAEQLIRDAKMTLYVERVGGHPLGRVLEQIPGAGAQRPAGGVVKVIVTAGGDFEGETPGAPRVYVAEITVPGILDRTRLQAERIAEDLGLTLQIEEAKQGLAGRVVDQMPAAGGRLPRGGVWRVWIGPGEDDNAPAPDKPPRTGPLPGGGDSPAPARPPEEPEDPAPAQPLSPGALPGGVPQPVAPGVNTEIPAGSSVPVGFTWKGVQGANAYLLEIEEQGAEGRWMPLARKPARSTAVLLEVERLDPRGTSRLRWRVTAVIGGRQGTPSPWIQLR